MAERQHREAVVGWRFWYTRPHDDRLTLHSPQIRHAYGRRGASDLRASGRIMRARCCYYDHAPPAEGCKCGVYACANVVDAIFRMRAMVRGMRHAATVRGNNPRAEAVRRAAEGPTGKVALVLTEVVCHQAVSHNDNRGETPILTSSGQFSMLGRETRLEVDPDTGRNCYSVIEIDIPVIRAAAVEIVRFFVPDEQIGAAAARDLAQRLAVRYGVEAVTGYPEYTPDEWDLRPEWMRTEPWQSMYSVDGVLAGAAA